MRKRNKHISVWMTEQEYVEAKTGEIFEMLLGSNPYQDLKDAGYEFRPVTIGE